MRRLLIAAAALAAGAWTAGAALAQGTAPEDRPAAVSEATPAPAPAVFSPDQREEIVAVLREALRTDPTILREAITALQESDRAEQVALRRRALTDNAEAVFRDPADPVLGNPQGRVTVVEFFDARCGYCKSFHPALLQLIQRDRDVRVVMKDLPILGPNSVLASRALLAAQRQGRYQPLLDALMRLRTEPTEAVLQAEAQRAGLDWARLRRDMDDPVIQARLTANMALAQRLGIEGTPAIIIGDTVVPGAVELPELQRLVAEARRRG